MTSLEDRGLDKYPHPALQHRDVFNISFILIYLLAMSTHTGARTSGNWWIATRLSSGLRTITRSSERRSHLLPPMKFFLIAKTITDSVFIRCDAVIAFHDEAYDMVLLGKIFAARWVAHLLGGRSPESALPLPRYQQAQQPMQARRRLICSCCARRFDTKFSTHSAFICGLRSAWQGRGWLWCVLDCA